MLTEELKEFAIKIEILSGSSDKNTLIKLGSIKGRVDEIFERYMENKGDVRTHANASIR